MRRGAKLSDFVAPLAAGGLAHYSRNNDDPSEPWGGPAIFATDLGIVDAVGLIESNFGDPGNLEIVVRAANALWHFWRGSDFSWNGPDPVPLSGVPETAKPIGIHSFIQSRYRIFSINGGGQIGFHEEPRSMVSARCLIKSAREGICLAPLTRSRMY